MEKAFYKEDDLFIFTSGSYNDYGVDGLFKVLKGFDVKPEIDRWAECTAREMNAQKVYVVEDDDEGLGFIAWMVDQGIICAVQCGEIFTGDDDGIDAEYTER